jgi:hypothetical protein
LPDLGKPWATNRAPRERARERRSTDQPRDRLIGGERHVGVIVHIRMHSRRMTRLTNAFSKKVENHAHAIALDFLYYNFVRVHKTLKATPAMATGDHKATLGDESGSNRNTRSRLD